MKKFLYTFALILAISSLSIAKSSNKKSVQHKKLNVVVQFFCNSAGQIVGAVGSNGTQFGDVGVGTCRCD